MDAQEPSICTVCRNILQFRQGLLQMQSDALFFGHHANLESLIASATTNCFVCSKIWDALTPNERSRLTQSPTMPWLTNMLITKKPTAGAITDAVASRIYSIGCAVRGAVNRNDQRRRLNLQRFYIQPLEGGLTYPAKWV
jgi:hypothetical protein